MQIVVDTIPQSFNAGFTDRMWKVSGVSDVTWRHVYPFYE